MFPRIPHSVITVITVISVISRALFFSLGCILLLLVGCKRDDYLSPDYGREELLHDRDDYLACSSQRMPLVKLTRLILELYRREALFLCVSSRIFHSHPSSLAQSLPTQIPAYSTY